MHHALEWLNLVFRWIHIITGIAWIGTSFYFNWLNDQLRPPTVPEDGVGGEVWSVHGGGFYRVSKYVVAPAVLPKTLHWFKWEAYTTWLSGIVLLALVYYLGADLYLVDPAVSSVTVPWAIAIGVGSLALAWILYHLLCRSPLGFRNLPFAAVLFALLSAFALGLTSLLGNRAAYIHVGAIIGTIMAANVFFVIIPSQRRMVAAMTAGRSPDGAEGLAAALRSRHNNYLTLPVLFIMVSNHYPMTYGYRYNWALLAGIGVIGVMTRHYFNLRSMGRTAGSGWILPAAALGIVALALVTRPVRSPVAQGAEPVTFAAVQEVVRNRCLPCHSAHPTQAGITTAPLGVRFDRPDQIQQYIQRIDARVVQTHTMPLGNLTGMTDAERDLIARWIAEGAVLP